MSDLVKRLKDEEARMGWLYDACSDLRDKHHGTASAFDFNTMRHAISGRDPVLTEAAARIEALEAALKPIKTLVDVAELDRSWRHTYPDDEVAVSAYGNETQDGKNVCKTHSITWGWLRHAASLLEPKTTEAENGK